MKTRIWLSPPHMSGREMHYVQQAFDSNWIAPAGPLLDLFEAKLCEVTGSSYAVATSSGTAALHLALIALGVSKGDYVLCQSLTFCASANPIVYQGANPVFIDSEPSTWNLCPDALETAIRHLERRRIRPKAIIVVHLYGMPALMDEILGIAARHGIPVIEDAAEALGSRTEARKLGTLGEMGILSFNGNKIITTSGGGALLCKSEKMARKVRHLASQAREEASYYEHRAIGYNYRLSNVCAGIGLGQLEVITARVEKRRAIFSFYKKTLSGITSIIFQPELPNAYSNRWLTAMQIDATNSSALGDAIVQRMEAENIEIRPVWKPMHLQPIYRDALYFGKNVAQELFENGLCLPSGSAMDEEALTRVITCILRAAEQ